MKENRTKKEIVSWLKTFLIALICAIVANNFLIASALVVSSSMENTIMTDSRVMGLRVAYVISEPKRFDIILFEPPDKDSEIPYIKRIIGLPNETVEIIAGKVYIDGSNVPLDDSFVKGEAHGNYGPFFVPEGAFFVMGDNRNSSSDSRHWVNRYVPRGNIIGRIYLEFYPTPHFFD